MKGEVYEQVTEIWIKYGHLEVMVEKGISKAQRRKSTDHTQEGQGCVGRNPELPKGEQKGMKPERQAGARLEGPAVRLSLDSSSTLARNLHVPTLPIWIKYPVCLTLPNCSHSPAS